MHKLKIGLFVSIIILASGCFSKIANDETCEPGTRGCRCLTTEISCKDAGLTCNAQNICDDKQCSPGEQGCACKDEGDPCNQNLECGDDKICQIPAGTKGGKCLPDGTCQPALACSGAVCIACQQGERGCDCDKGTCHTGIVCIRNRCVTEASEALTKPENPSCYTPCSADITAADGKFTKCPHDGLLPGCLNNRTCQEGSCVLDSESGLSCVSDADCPDFQACFSGKCMANCSSNKDCGDDLECFRKVCRLACTSEQDTCPTGQSCVTNDGVNGYCGPLVAPEVAPKCEIVGDYLVEPLRLDFSNMVTSNKLSVSNNGPAAIDVTIKVKNERVINENGIVQYVTNGALPWLRFGLPGSCGAVNTGGVFHLTIEAGELASIEVCHGATTERSRWEGTLEISNLDLGTKSVDVSYAERPDGQWVGTAYYFANFGGDTEISQWIEEGRQDRPAVDVVQNAFVRRWAEFKFGRMTFDEFRAVMQATQTESWRWPSVQTLCAQKNPGGACYLYNNTEGFSTFSTSLDTFPVPSGIVELPFAMNIRQVSGPGPNENDCNSNAIFEGRIDSDQALQYAGNPKVVLALQGLPPTCGTKSFGTSVVNVLDFNSDAHLGGRYLSSLSDGMCRRAGSNGRFKQYRIPWLVPGFVANTDVDPSDQTRYTYSCRDRLLPFDGEEDLNLSLAEANPIPDGRARHRTLSLVDGALVDAKTLVILFRETSESFFDPQQSYSAYGYMVLQRKAADLKSEDFIATSPQYDDSNISQLGVSCSQELLDKILGSSSTLKPGSSAETVVNAVLSGPDGGIAVPLDASSTEHIHYLCVASDQTATFSGYVGDAAALECPPNSTVIYFTLTDVADSVVAMHSCNLNGDCNQTLQNWVATGYGQIRLDPRWQCQNDEVTYCDTNRRDLREGKTFFAATTNPALLPLQTQVDQAFAYKTRFMSREGLNMGFTPSICSKSGSEIPYCYNPADIEAIISRVDCALHIYSKLNGNGTPNGYALSLETQNKLRAYFSQNFAYQAHENLSDGTIVKSEGFDYLNAELRIMLGDEAYASAFASRFDLAGAAVYGFQGANFEPHGINLSGIAGFQLFRLYQANQQYQSVLDRFFALSSSFALPSEQSFVSSATVTTYFSRIIRASTQKAKTWSEIAERYHSMGRPDLAKLVIGRAYTATYMESAILASIMRQVLGQALPEDKDQIVSTIDAAQRSYRDALLNMQTVNNKVSAALNFMGFTADYIPFPALDPNDTNAFDKLSNSATKKLQLAIERENEALANNHQYETDSASFQSELTRIRNEYENQLASICGTFTGNDGQIYPAISKYAQMNTDAAALGDPCGRMGTGGLLYETGASIVAAQLDVSAVQQQFDNTLAEIDSEKQRVAKQCGLIKSEIDFLIKQDNKTNSIQDSIDDARGDIDGLREVQQVVSAFSQNMSSCSPTVTLGVTNPGSTYNIGACIGAKLSYATLLATGPNISKKEQAIRSKEQKLRELQQATMYWQVNNKCSEAQVDSQARVRSLVLNLAELKIAALKTSYSVMVAQAKYQELENQEKRLVAQQTDAEQMSINIAAARNDPNVRIYKNDTILAADRTFNDALAEAYRATKVYEYYTSQSYAKLGDLYIIRMAAHGEPSLEAYLSELFKAFDEFEEQYGNPDIRVAVISMRDDVLQIPRLSDNGQALSHTERVRLFRQKLSDVRLLDTRGYLVAPFSTRLDMVSPLTRDHKVSYIEAEIEGANVGDDLGRVYLTQSGTSVLRSVNDTSLFYALPERTAVIDVSFNGHKVFVPDVYKNQRLRDRPLLNTNWSLVFNQKDELVNKDIDLSSITDIRLYVYYSDFTTY